MTILIIGLLLLQTVLLVAILGVLNRNADIERRVWDELRELRLVSRTRIRQASIQSGAADPEQKLVRLGRVAKSRRVVVGGDGDSDLNKALNGILGGDDDNG